MGSRKVPRRVTEFRRLASAVERVGKARPDKDPEAAASPPPIRSRRAPDQNDGPA